MDERFSISTSITLCFVNYLSSPPHSYPVFPLGLVLRRHERSLEDLLLARSLTLHQSLPIAAQLGRIVEWIHSQRVCWGDVKPANFLVEIDPISLQLQVVACDFATAVIFGEPLLGVASPLYLPPEGFSLTKLTGHASYDIWSFGVVLFRLLTGHELFADRDDALRTLAGDAGVCEQTVGI